MKKTYLFLADGFEEVEALATVDLLRRAGVEVETVSINKTLAVRGAHGIEVAADTMLADCEPEARMLICPGGMPGASNRLPMRECVNCFQPSMNAEARLLLSAPLRLWCSRRSES